jgi:hypothetical protein
MGLEPVGWIITSKARGGEKYVGKVGVGSYSI